MWHGKREAKCSGTPARAYCAAPRTTQSLVSTSCSFAQKRNATGACGRRRRCHRADLVGGRAACALTGGRPAAPAALRRCQRWQCCWHGAIGDAALFGGKCSDGCCCCCCCCCGSERLRCSARSVERGTAVHGRPRGPPCRRVGGSEPWPPTASDPRRGCFLAVAYDPQRCRTGP